MFTAQFTLHKALPWLSRSVTGLSWRRPVFDLRSVFVRFVGGKVAVGQFFLPVLRFSPVSINPPLLHTHLHLHAALTRRTNGRSSGTFQKATLLRISGWKNTCSLLTSGRLKCLQLHCCSTFVAGMQPCVTDCGDNI
jgi:hypothetical protein